MQLNFQANYDRDLQRLLRSDEKADYALRSLSSHLYDSGQHEKLLRILLGNAAWLDATLQKFHVYNVYVDALDLALRHFSDPSQPEDILAALALQTAKQAVSESLRNITDDDLLYMVQRGDFESALSYARLRPLEYARFQGLLMIAKAVGGWNGGFEQALNAGISISDTQKSAEALYELALASRKLNQEWAENVLFQALEVARKVAKPKDRFSLLSTITESSPLNVSMVYDELVDAIQRVKTNRLSFERGDDVILLTKLARRLADLHDPRAANVLEDARVSLGAIPRSTNYNTTHAEAHLAFVSLLFDLSPEQSISAIENASQTWQGLTSSQLSKLARDLLIHHRISEVRLIMQKVTDDYELRSFAERLAEAGYYDDALSVGRRIQDEIKKVLAIYQTALFMSAKQNEQSEKLFRESVESVKVIVQAGGNFQKTEIGKMLDTLVATCLTWLQFEDAQYLAAFIPNEENRRSVVSNAIAPALALAGQWENAEQRAQEGGFNKYLEALFDKELKSNIPELEAQIVKMPKYAPMPVQGELLPKLVPVQENMQVLVDEMKKWEIEYVDSLVLIMSKPDEMQSAIINGHVREFFEKVKRETPSPNVLLPGLTPFAKMYLLQSIGAIHLNDDQGPGQLSTLQRQEESFLLGKALNRLEELLLQNSTAWIGPAINYLIDLFSRCTSTNASMLHRFFAILAQANNVGVNMLLDQIIELAEGLSNSTHVAGEIQETCHLWVGMKKINNARAEQILAKVETKRNRSTPEVYLVISINLLEAALLVDRPYARTLLEDIIRTLTKFRDKNNYLEIAARAAQSIKKVDSDRALMILDEIQATKLASRSGPVNANHIKSKTLIKIAGIWRRTEMMHWVSASQNLFELVQTTTNLSEDLIGLSNEMLISGDNTKVEALLTAARQRAKEVEILRPLSTQPCQGEVLAEVANLMYRANSPQTQDTFSEAIAAARAIPNEISDDLSEDKKRFARMSYFNTLFKVMQRLHEANDRRAFELINENLAASFKAEELGIAALVRYMIKMGYRPSEGDVQTLITMSKVPSSTDWVLDCLVQSGHSKEALQAAVTYSREYYQNFFMGNPEGVMDRYYKREAALKLPLFLAEAGHQDEAVAAYHDLLGDKLFHLMLRPFRQSAKDSLHQQLDAPTRLGRWFNRIGLLVIFWFIPIMVIGDWIVPVLIQQFGKNQRMELLHLRLKTAFEIGQARLVEVLSNKLVVLTKKIWNSQTRSSKKGLDPRRTVRDAVNNLIGVQEFDKAEGLVSNLKNSPLRDELNLSITLALVKSLPPTEALQKLNEELPDYLRQEPLQQLVPALLKEHIYQPWFETMKVSSLEELMDFLLTQSPVLELTNKELIATLLENFVRIASWSHPGWQKVYTKIMAR